MRTTLDLDSDILSAAKGLAAQQACGVGRVISDLVRKTLTSGKVSGTRARNGIPLFPTSPDAPVVTPEDVKRVEDEP